MKILILGAHHVHELLGYRECADVMREALADLARGRIEQPLRTIVRPRDAAGFMALMPAYAAPGDGGEAGYGLKAICITPGNPALGKDTHQGGVLLFAAATGEPLAMVNASAITEIRTAATSAVATDLLARPGAAELAIIGTGVQARAHAHAVAADPATHRDPRRRARSRPRPRDGGRTGRPARPAGHRLRRGAQRGGGGRHHRDRYHVAAAGPATQWLSPGTHVNAVSACVPGDREIDTATMASAAIFADSRESVRERSRRLPAGPAPAGPALTGPGRPARSCRSGPRSAKCSPAPRPAAPMTTEITLFESLGLAAEDLAAATYVYEQARHRGTGTPADF